MIQHEGAPCAKGWYHDPPCVERPARRERRALLDALWVLHKEGRLGTRVA